MKFIPPQLSNRVKTGFTLVKARISAFISRFPLISFLGLMLVLVILAAIGNKLRQPAVVPETAQPAPKEVTTFAVGGTSTMTVEAKIEKSGIINLVAQTSGVVQTIKAKEGSTVKRGSSLFTLSTNYQGANAAAVSRQMSQKSYQFLVDNYQSQVDAIHRSQDIARRNETQASELRDIARQSLDDTKGLISLNEEILNTLNTRIDDLTASNVGGVNDADLAQAKQTKAGILSALSNLRSGLRNTEYVNNNDEDPAQIAILNRDNALQQLDIQEKTLALNKETAQLSLRLAQISESLMYPGSPVTGTVERIHVKVGQAVTPGTLLATIRGDKNSATAVVLASQNVAQTVSRLESSYAVVGDQKVAVTPRSVSQEPTDGSLHSIIYTLPDSLGSLVTNDSYIQMILPIGAGHLATGDRLFIPLDAVYQAQGKASVNVVDETQNPPQAKNIEVKLGEVTGQYVEVLSGLTNGNQVILNRNVTSGEPITIKQ